jgi:hypothetical protein
MALQHTFGRGITLTFHIFWPHLPHLKSDIENSYAKLSSSTLRTFFIRLEHIHRSEPGLYLPSAHFAGASKIRANLRIITKHIMLGGKKATLFCFLPDTPLLLYAIFQAMGVKACLFTAHCNREKRDHGTGGFVTLNVRSLPRHNGIKAVFGSR